MKECGAELMTTRERGCLILADGSEFHGYLFGARKETCCEVVFTTAPCGYVETLSDPSYGGQGLVLTFPELGNHGVIRSQMEAPRLSLAAVFVKQVHQGSLDPRADLTLEAWLLEEGVPGLCGIDTRALTFHLRQHGSMKGKLCLGSYDKATVLDEIENWQMPFQVKRVSTPAVYALKAAAMECPDGAAEQPLKIALMDFGCKKSMAEVFVHLGCTVRVYPYYTTAGEILASKPDGIFLANGPGDPMDCGREIGEIRKLIHSGKDIFAICLGHQLLALAAGARTRKMRFGHRGENHPVRHIETGKLYISSQNHGYVVEREGLQAQMRIRPTWESVQDGTLEGMRFQDYPIASVQFHPEAHPGPEDTRFLFGDFVRSLRRGRGRV